MLVEAVPSAAERRKPLSIYDPFFSSLCQKNVGIQLCTQPLLAA